MNYEEATCPELEPGTGEWCYRGIGHDGDHYPKKGLRSWPNASTPRAKIELDREELYTLWVLMWRSAPNHLRFGRINAKLEAALRGMGEEL